MERNQTEHACFVGLGGEGWASCDVLLPLASIF